MYGRFSIVVRSAWLLMCLLAMRPSLGESWNVLMITADDMNCDSVGVFGCELESITPNIDGLARQGMRFERAHVTIAVCQPTRAVWMTGLYPFRNGARGFEEIKPEIVTLPEALKSSGYLNGLLGKTTHVVPSRAHAFHVRVPQSRLGGGRSPQSYYEESKRFLDRVRTEKRPFFLMVNAHDPHRPFAGSEQERRRVARGDFPTADKVYTPREVSVPGFLPDLPPIRQEIAEYYSSVHRADATVGAALRALKESGFERNTIVMFLSDHGMALPFAKTNCWYHSTRTPLIVRWPGQVSPDSIDAGHFVSGIDVMPTLLDALEVPSPAARDGQSFVPLLKGQVQTGRERVLTVFHTTAGKRDYGMRAVHDDEFLYIYNAWSDGETRFKNESQGGRTMKAMLRAAERKPEIAARVKSFLFRVPEELYAWHDDPDCLHNLAERDSYGEKVENMRKVMLDTLRQIDDPIAVTFASAFPALD